MMSDYGKGSTFTILLPVNVDASQTPTVHVPLQEPATGHEAGARDSGQSGFLIDNDSTTSEFLRRTLAKEGHEFGVTSKGHK